MYPLYRYVFNMPDGSRMVWDRDQRDGNVIPINIEDWIVFVKDEEYCIAQVKKIEDNQLHWEIKDQDWSMSGTIAKELAQKLRPSYGISIGF